MRSRTVAKQRCFGNEWLDHCHHHEPPPESVPEEGEMLTSFSCPARPGTNEVHPPPGIECETALRIAELCVLRRVSAPGWTYSFRPYETNGAVLAVVRKKEILKR